MCKSAAFLKPPSKLNPSAEEWRPPQLRCLIHPLHQAPPPAVFGGHHPQQLLWLPHQLVHFPPAYTSYVLRPCTADAVYHSPPSIPFPAPGPPLAAAPPPLAGEKKVLEHYVERPAKAASKMWRPPPPQIRREWVLRKTEGDGAAVAMPSPAVVYRRRTTVMVRNIPNQLRRDYLVEFLDSYCSAYSLKYDFMYLPMDFRSKDNLGYAFVNFPRDGDAYKFKKILQNYKWGTVVTNKGLYTSKKICAITWATFQGKEKLVKRFEDTVFDCDDLEFLPVVFDPPRGGSDVSSPVVVGRVKREVS